GRGLSASSSSAYAAAKGGIIAFTRKLAFELGPYGININAIAPSRTLTERIRPRWNQSSPEDQQAEIDRTPLRRVAEAPDQAKGVAQPLFYEDLEDVVLAGTSSGGMVVCRVAESIRDRIGRLAFVDALALLDAEKISDIVTRSTAAANTGGLTRGPTREDAANRLVADLDPAARAWALDRYT